jgi:hypothetical protein
MSALTGEKLVAGCWLVLFVSNAYVSDNAE